MIPPPSLQQSTPGGVVLSPVPRVPGRETRRQIHPSAKIWMSPKKPDSIPTPPPSNGRVLTFTFGVTGQIVRLDDNSTRPWLRNFQPLNIIHGKSCPSKLIFSRLKNALGKLPNPQVTSLLNEITIATSKSSPCLHYLFFPHKSSQIFLFCFRFWLPFGWIWNGGGGEVPGLIFFLFFRGVGGGGKYQGWFSSFFFELF